MNGGANGGGDLACKTEPSPQVDPPGILADWLVGFGEGLGRPDLAAATVCGYTHDVGIFRRWQEGTLDRPPRDKLCV